MSTVPYREGEINLPDVYDVDEVDALVRQLDRQQYRYGAKKLSKCFLAIRSHLNRIEQHKNEAERLINIVNGIPTENQQQYYTEKKLRTAALRFYSTLSFKSLQEELLDRGDYWAGKVDQMTRDALITQLVKGHIERELENDANG